MAASAASRAPRCRRAPLSRSRRTTTRSVTAPLAIAWTRSRRAEAVRAIAAVYLLLPQIPMLFMGEEWGAAQPFPFFCDFGPELAAAVRKGRREEFARFPEFRDPAVRETIPDPTAEATFLSAKLAWGDRDRAPHAERLARYRRISASAVARSRRVLPPSTRVGLITCSATAR